MKTIGTMIVIGLIAVFSFEKKMERTKHFNVESNVISTSNFRNDTIKVKIDSLEKDIYKIKQLERELGIK